MTKTNIRQQAVSVRKSPERTCVACRRVKDKRELVRLVRVSDGSVEVDTSGKMAGRGAYLCRTGDCWRGGVQGKRLEYALRATLTGDNRERLVKYGEELAEGK